MRSMHVLFAAAMCAACIPTAVSQGKCDANIGGFKIRKVYVVGDQYNGVVWAYKHRGEETCFTPVTGPAQADAVLELYDRDPGGPQRDDSSFSVYCNSRGGSSMCTDSSGNMMTVDCTATGCSSYYGPNPAVEVMRGLSAWVHNAWYQAEANLYTTDHKLIWRSVDQKGGSWHDLWPDKLRAGTASPVCKRGAFDTHRYKNYRDWAQTRCGIAFDPPVSIDLKLRAKLSAADEAERQRQQMNENAREAAAKQSK